MKYIAALFASAGVAVFCVAIAVFLGFEHNGGALGMTAIWAAVISTWIAVIKHFNDKDDYMHGARTNKTKVANQTVTATHPPKITTDGSATETMNAVDPMGRQPTSELTNNTSTLSSDIHTPPHATPAPMTTAESEAYALAMKEAGNESLRHAGCWARAISDSPTDPDIQRSTYIKYRSRMIIDNDNRCDQYLAIVNSAINNIRSLCSRNKFQEAYNDYRHLPCAPTDASHSKQIHLQQIAHDVNSLKKSLLSSWLRHIENSTRHFCRHGMFTEARQELSQLFCNPIKSECSTQERTNLCNSLTALLDLSIHQRSRRLRQVMLAVLLIVTAASVSLIFGIPYIRGARIAAENKSKLMNAYMDATNYCAELESALANANNARDDERLVILHEVNQKWSTNRYTIFEYLPEDLSMKIFSLQDRASSIVKSIYKGPTPGFDWLIPDIGISLKWIKHMNCWVGEFEITQSEYSYIRRKTESAYPTSGEIDLGPIPIEFGLRPKVNVTYGDCLEFLKWLNEREWSACRLMYFNEYRLPTEKEWMSFASCGRDWEYPWGRLMPPEFGNYDDSLQAIYGYRDGSTGLAIVGKSGKNALGLYGVGGNALEWIDEEYPASGGDNRPHRKLKGGSFLTDDSRISATANSLSLSVFWHRPPSEASHDAGFRIILYAGSLVPVQIYPIDFGFFRDSPLGDNH